MNYKLLIICIAFSLHLTPFAFADDDDDEQENDLVSIDKTQMSLEIDEKKQSTLGIVTAIAEPFQLQQEWNVYGKALSIEPLLALRHRYLSALSDKQAVAATAKQLQQNTQRQQTLYTQGISSKRHLQEQQALWQNHEATLAGHQLQAQAIQEESLVAWGKTLSEWALSPSIQKLEPFIQGKKTLLQITVPSDKNFNEKQSISVSTSSNRADANTAEFIAQAPQTMNDLQGNSYFLQTNHRKIHAGIPIVAWLKDNNNWQKGVIIPKTALLRVADKAIVYIKTDATHFNRRVINEYSPNLNNYFIHKDLRKGESVVITGAQQLLSEELRRQIPKESNDDDDDD